MANFQLTPAQKSAIQHFHKIGNMHGFSWNTVQALINKGIIEQFEHDVICNCYDLLRFTAEGQAWADVQFGSPEPDPTPDTEIAPDSEPVTHCVVCDSRLLRDGSCGICGYDTEPSPVVAENAPAEPVAVQPVAVCACGEPLTIAEEIGRGTCLYCAYDGLFDRPANPIQWHTPDSLRPENAAYLAYMARYNARQSAPMPRSRVLRGSQGRTPMNMQKRLKSKPATQKREPLHETVLQIVSRIQTPLTGQVRRVA